MLIVKIIYVETGKNIKILLLIEVNVDFRAIGHS